MKYSLLKSASISKTFLFTSAIELANLWDINDFPLAGVGLVNRITLPLSCSFSLFSILIIKDWQKFCFLHCCCCLDHFHFHQYKVRHHE